MRPDGTSERVKQFIPKVSENLTASDIGKEVTAANGDTLKLINFEKVKKLQKVKKTVQKQILQKNEDGTTKEVTVEEEIEVEEEVEVEVPIYETV